MKCLIPVNIGFLILTFVLACTLLVQQETITTLISNQSASISTDARQDAALMVLRRRIRDLEKRVAHVEKQGDLIAAASRMGWMQAYKFLKTVSLERDNVQ